MKMPNQLSHNSMYSPFDQYLTICWQRAFGKSNKRDSIYVTEVFALIRELEDFIGAPGLFGKDELAILKGMAEKRPLLLLRRLETENFILQLVNFDSMENFLRSRARTSLNALRRLVDNYPKDHGKHEPISKRPTISIESSIPQDDTTWFGNWWRSYNYTKDHPSQVSESTDFTTRRFSRDTKAEKPYLSGYDAMRQASNHFRADTKNTYDPGKHSNNINSRYSGTTIPGSFNDFTTTNNEDRIRELELLCKRYETELQSRRSVSSDVQQEKLILKLQEALHEQDRLVKELKTKLDFGDSKSSNVVRSLPFIKQYLMFSRLKQDRMSIRIVFVDCLALLLSFALIVNLLKLLYYSFLTLGTRISLSNGKYIEDIDDETIITFSWLQQLPWLEYKIYQLQDWMEGY